MTYGITTYGANAGVVLITKEIFEEVRISKKNLLQVLFLEEKFDLLLENYYEYENELLLASSRMMIFRGADYFSINEDRNLVSRRIVNMLTTGKMYLEQSIHHLNNIYGKENHAAKESRAIQSRVYDNFLGYRTMSAVRNYVQHRGMPIHGINFYQRRIENGANVEVLLSVTPYMKISSLEEDKDFKATILQELKKISKKDKIDVKPIIREYIEGIGQIHKRNRELLREDVENWEKILGDIRKKYKQAFRDTADNKTLVAIEFEENHYLWLDNEIIFREFITKRKNLENKNVSLNNLHKSFATNQVIE